MGSQGSKGACEQYELSNQLCQRYDQFYTFLVHEAKYKGMTVICNDLYITSNKCGVSCS